MIFGATKFAHVRVVWSLNGILSGFVVALAPTQSEPPFLITQLTAMAIFIVLGTFPAQRFRAGQWRPA